MLWLQIDRGKGGISQMAGRREVRASSARFDPLPENLASPKIPKLVRPCMTDWCQVLKEVGGEAEKSAGGWVLAG